MSSRLASRLAPWAGAPARGFGAAARGAAARGVRAYSTGDIETVPLAYELWQPRKPATTTPIVFLHGLFGARANNRTVSKVLARDLSKDVYGVDLRNHGESPHAARHDYVAMAADVERFIEEHEIPRPIIIGHSMGARAAMAVALRRPDLCSKLISVDNGPVSQRLSPAFAQYVLGMKEIARAGVATQRDAFAIMDKYEKSTPIQQFLLSNFKRDGDVYKPRIPLDTLGKALGHISEFEFPASEYRFTGPTLLIRGTDSSFVPDEQLQLMGELFPRFTVRDVKAGHWVISENPKEFIRVTEEFLDESE